MSKYSLKDSFELVNEISSLNVAKHCMCSLDAKSLFTNIPLHKTVGTICSYIPQEQLTLPSLSEKLRKLLLLCRENVKFSFDRQIDGVVMGSPLGPLLADIFMSHVEKKVVEDTASSLFYK
jgi:hypothetical protein